MTSFLYKELTERELFTVISESLHTEIVDFRLLTGGLFNTTYLVETSDFGAVVLRVGPVNRHLLVPFEHELMTAEAKAYELCRAENIPVSEIIALDVSKKIIDRDFMIVRFIPSKPMSEVVLESADKARICRDIGVFTAKMHGIELPAFGRLADVFSGRGFSSWSECVFDQVRSLESVALPAEIFSDIEIETVHRLFKRAKPLLDEVKTPKLVHTDLWMGNILIGTASEKPEFAAIIDADRAMGADPEMEFSSIVWSHSEPDFWCGYGKKLSSELPNLIRRCVYTVMNRMINAYVYLCEYGQPENFASEKEKMAEQIGLLERYLDVWES